MKCLYPAWLIGPEELKDYLRSHGIEPVMQWKESPSEEELIDLVRDVDAAFAAGDRYTKRVIDSAPSLKIIAIVGVGFDNVDVQAATSRGIWVTNSPVPELAYGMAEHTMALILSIVKRVPPRNAELRAGLWETAKWRPEIDDLYHLTLGLLGVGRIGSEVARRAKAFGMKIIYYDVLRRSDLEESIGMVYVQFDELLAQSDILSIHTPLTHQSRNMINASALGKMKKTAILVNTARGAIVDETALLEALKKANLGGAGLDVFSEEPMSQTHPFYKLGDSLPNLVMTPHSGTGIGTELAEARGAAEEIVSVLSGRQPKYAVNKVTMRTA